MLRLGTVLAEQGRLKEADRLAGRLRSIDSCSVELRVMEMVLSLARGELSAVLELAAALPHELLEDLSIRSTRVLALAGLGRVEDAERLLSSMPPETATSTEARVLSMFALRDRFEEAAAWWERRRGSSGSSDAPTAIAISGIRAVDPDRADRLQAAIAQRRFGPAAADVIAGMAAYAAGDHRSAAERLGKAVALRPDDVSLIATCASTFNATGRASEAATMLEIARARHPGQVPLLVESARSSLSLHRYHEAEQRFLEAHAHDPAGIGPMRGLAELTLLSGRHGDCLDWCDRIRQRDHDEISEVCASEALAGSLRQAEGLARLEAAPSQSRQIFRQSLYLANFLDSLPESEIYRRHAAFGS